MLALRQGFACHAGHVSARALLRRIFYIFAVFAAVWLALALATPAA
jgi:hypothetical protein